MEKRSSLKIALLGTRGVPASYSGFETCVEQLGQRLVQRGHHVYVYCRSNHIKYPGNLYKGMHLIKLPTVSNKYLDTIVHTFLSVLHSLKQNYDIGVFFIAGNSLLSWVPRLVGTKTILNVDGLDWKRDKWPWLAKKYLQLSEFFATMLPNLFLTDSLVVQSYYEDTYHKIPPYIPYGSEVDILPPGDVLKAYDLTPGGYILFVGRLVPENCAHHLVAAFSKLDTSLKCVIVGDASYAEEYKQELKSIAGNDPRFVFTGYVFGKGYQELGSNAYIFVETSSVGGTHPALVEAMAFGSCIIVNNTLENLETIGNDGFSYDGTMGEESLRIILEKLINNPDTVSEFSLRAQDRARTLYSWDAVTDEYENLFLKVLKKSVND